MLLDQQDLPARPGLLALLDQLALTLSSPALPVLPGPRGPRGPPDRPALIHLSLALLARLDRRVVLARPVRRARLERRAFRAFRVIRAFRVRLGLPDQLVQRDRLPLRVLLVRPARPVLLAQRGPPVQRDHRVTAIRRRVAPRSLSLVAVR